MQTPLGSAHALIANCDQAENLLMISLTAFDFFAIVPMVAQYSTTGCHACVLSNSPMELRAVPCLPLVTAAPAYNFLTNAEFIQSPSIYCWQIQAVFFFNCLLFLFLCANNCCQSVCFGMAFAHVWFCKTPWEFSFLPLHVFHVLKKVKKWKN